MLIGAPVRLPRLGVRGCDFSPRAAGRDRYRSQPRADPALASSERSWRKVSLESSIVIRAGPLCVMMDHGKETTDARLPTPLLLVVPGTLPSDVGVYWRKINLDHHSLQDRRTQTAQTTADRSSCTAQNVNKQTQRAAAPPLRRMCAPRGHRDTGLAFVFTTKLLLSEPCIDGTLQIRR